MAAAIAGKADCIVTANLSDFPVEFLAAHGLEALHPIRITYGRRATVPVLAVAIKLGHLGQQVPRNCRDLGDGTGGRLR